MIVFLALGFPRVIPICPHPSGALGCCSRKLLKISGWYCSRLYADENSPASLALRSRGLSPYQKMQTNKNQKAADKRSAANRLENMDRGLFILHALAIPQNNSRIR